VRVRSEHSSVSAFTLGLLQAWRLRNERLPSAEGDVFVVSDGPTAPTSSAAYLDDVAQQPAYRTAHPHNGAFFWPGALNIIEVSRD